MFSLFTLSQAERYFFLAIKIFQLEFDSFQKTEIDRQESNINMQRNSDISVSAPAKYQYNFSMTEPNVLDLNCLLAKLHSNADLDTSDIQTFKWATQMMASSARVSSQMVNITNECWMALQNLRKELYWNTIGTFTGSEETYTKTMGLNSMAKRIALEGGELANQVKTQIIQFLLDLQETISKNESLFMSSLKSATCQALVAFLRVECHTYLTTYVESIKESMETVTAAHLIFSLDILGRIVREGYDSYYDGMLLTYERRQFKVNVEKVMRIIIQVAIYALTPHHNSAPMLIETALRFLKNTIAIVPAFQLFNINLIDVLINLLGNSQYEEDTFVCIRELFSFTETKQLKEHHPKIALRLFKILEELLTRYQDEQNYINKKTVNNIDKQSESTTTSRSHRSLHRHTSPAEIVQLLNLFLTRYVPFTQEVPQNNSYDVESDSHNKIYYDKELYDMFAGRLNQFIDFLIIFGNGLPFNLVDKFDCNNQVEQCMLSNINLILKFAVKLKVHYTSVKELIKMLIVKFSPLDPAVRRIYALMCLILGPNKIYDETEVRSFTEEFMEIYKGVIKTILENYQLRVTYINVLKDIWEQIWNISLQNQTVNALNLINRFSWSMVYTFSQNSIKIPQQLKIAKIGAQMIHLVKECRSDAIKKCLNINLRYMHCLGSSYFANIIMFDSLPDNDLVWELNIAVMSKLCRSKNFSIVKTAITRQKYKESSTFENLTQHIRDLQKKDCYHQQFQTIYPAMLRLCTEILKDITKADERVAIQKNIKENVMKILVYDPLENHIKLCLQHQNNLSLFLKELNKYMTILELVSQEMIKMSSQGQNIDEKTCYGLVRVHHKFVIPKYLPDLEVIYNIIAQQIVDTNYETYEIRESLEFRQNMHKYLISIMKFHTIVEMTPKETKNRSSVNNKINAMQLFERILQILTRDFTAQPNHKCPLFLQLQLEWFKTINTIQSQNLPKVLHKNLSEIMKDMNIQNLKSDQLRIKYMQFWHQIVDNYLMELTQQQVQTMVNIFSIISEVNSTQEVQLCIEWVEQMFKKIDYWKNHYKHTPVIWSFVVEFVKTTFEQLINFPIKNEPLFLKLAHLLYLEIYVIGSHHLPLKTSNRSTQNRDELFIWLNSHIHKQLMDRFDSMFKEEHDKMLHDCFEEKRQDVFVEKMRDYKVRLIRYLNRDQQRQVR